ncbi:MAG: DnaJ domain-containing protein [Flavobacterium sp.]
MEAFQALELDGTCDDMNLARIHKQYRKLALKYHPDKNGDTERFQLINEAYSHLKTVLEDESGENSETMEPTPYENILRQFVASVMDPAYLDVATKLIQKIVTTGKTMSAKWFEHLDKETALNVFIFLSRYRTILYLSDELLESIRQLVVDKYKDVVIYRLNPSIDDLIHNHVYKLYDQERLYLVPLWHSESYFDGSGCEIIALCDPVLPDHMTIDDCNQLIVEHQIYGHGDLVEMLLNNESFGVEIAGEMHWIPLSELHMKTEQYYRIKGKGLTQIKKDNLYHVSDRADIIVKVMII